MIHVANLRYAGTYEDDVYQALSDRFADIFAVLGQLPDSFVDDWITAAETDRNAVKNFPSRVALAKPAMTRRYWRDVTDADGLNWESTAKIFSTRDVEEYMRTGW